jgi:hypothetical protein
MNRAVPEGFELADEPQPWVSRNPGVTLSLLTAIVGVGAVAFGTWIDDRQRPQLEEIRTAITELRRENRQDSRYLSNFQIETTRWFGDALTGISESANVAMPDRPKSLDRAEGHVRDIQERVN